MKYSSLNVSVELSCKEVANTVGYNLVMYITIWPIWPLTNMAQSYRHLAKGTLAGELLVERLKVAGGLLLQVGVVNLQTISLPNGILLPKHLTSWRREKQEEKKITEGCFFAPHPHNHWAGLLLLLIFSLSRWTRTCLGGLPVVLEVHLHNPEVFHDPAVPSQMADRLKLLLQRLTDLDSLSSVLPNPSTLQQRLSCSFALFSSQRRASVFCSIITTHGW